MRTFDTARIGRWVKSFGLGESIDKDIEPQDIEDATLMELWSDAQVKMNEIQLYLETVLGENFFLR